MDGSISVVLPTKDRADWLPRVVPSYLVQPELGELIIVNDGSTDGTAAVLERLAGEDPRVRVVHHATTHGVPAAKNSGIDAATMDLLFFGEDDLELSENYLATLKTHRETSGADLMGGRNIWRYDQESAEDALARHAEFVASAVDTRNVMVDTNLRLHDDTPQDLLPSAMMGPTELFLRLRFDEGYRANGWREESDFQLRAVASGLRLYSCPHAISYNYMIAHDRGGAHAADGMKRVYWMVRNNARFMHRNRVVIAERFDVGNPSTYLVRFTWDAVAREVLLPRARQGVALTRRWRVRQPG